MKSVFIFARSTTMKQSLKKIAFGFLALTFPCLGWSADIWAQWTTFEGLTSENPITPTTSKTFANQNAGTWKVYLGSGSVTNGILTTGAEAPAYVDFNAPTFNAGRNGDPTSFLLEVELPIVGNADQSKPLAHIGNGSKGYGFCLSDSQTVKGTWGNTWWNNSTNNSGMTVSALATTETKTIWLACAAATTSAPVTTFAIDGSETITKEISGLTGTDVDVSKIFLGNYNGGTTNGLQYKLKSLTVYHGRVTEAELKNTIANLSLYYKATISENKAYSELEWTLDDEATTAKPTSIDGVELNVTQNATLTMDSEPTIPILTIDGEGPLTIGGTFTATATNIATNVDVSNATTTLGAVTIAEGATLTIGANTSYTSIAGAGTLVLTTTPDTSAIRVSDTWTGTVKVQCALGNAFNYNAIGREGSTIEITSTGSANYFAKNAQIAANLEINGTISQNNGWSDDGGATLSGTITGTGTLQTSGDQSDVIQLTGDASGFAGTITVNGKHVISFGPQTDLDDDSNRGKLFIQSGKTANIAANKTWTATGGVHIYGAIGGAGTIGSATTFYNGATIDASTNALTVTGTIAWPTTTGANTVKVKVAEWNEGSAVVVLRGVEAIPTGTTFALVNDAGEALTGGYTANLSDGHLILTYGEKSEIPKIEANAELTTTAESMSWAAIAGGAYVKTGENTSLTITFTEENQTFTFDNELQLSFTSITVTGEYAGKVTMAEGDVVVETAETTINTSADFTGANGMHFGAATINAGKTLTIDTDSQIRSITGAGQFALAENAEITFTGATAHTGGTHLSEGSTLTIKHTNSLSTAGAITGSGRLVIAGVTPVNKTGLTAATNWTGVVEFTGALPAGCNFDDYGNEQSMVRFNGASGYTAQTSAGTKMAVDLELVAGGLTINNANSGQLAIVTGALTGSGSLTMSATANNNGTTYIAPRLVFEGDTTGFTGNIQVNSSETTRAPAVIFGTASNGNTASPFGLTLGDTNSIANYDPNGKIVVAPGATASVVGTWTAAQGVHVYGTLGGSGKISSALTLNNGTTLVLGESPITVTGAVTVNECLNVTAEAIATKTMKILATAGTPTIADDATATLNGTACTLSAQADGLYVVIPGFDNYSDVTVQKLLAITGSKIPTTITGFKGITELSAADISASLELFENVTTAGDEGDTVNVQYNFGMTSLKINAERKVEAVISVETTVTPDTSTITQGVTIELYAIGANDTEVVLASMVLTAPEKTVTLITSQTYTEIMNTLFGDTEGIGTLKVYVRAKKASLGAIVASATLDATTGTLISSHGQALDLYTFALADAIPAEGAVTFNVAGVGAYEGQAYTLTMGETTYDSTLSEAGTITFNLPTAVAAGTEATLAVANATGAIEVLETGTGPVRIQKLLARTPEEDLNPNYDPENDATTRIFTPPAEGYRDMYRIPAIASDGNGEIVAIYDLRYIEGDLGQTTATNAKTSVDIAESYSTDGGLTWATFTNTVGENSIDSYVKIAIDVPNAYNFATIGGDTTIGTGRNAYSSLNGGNALSLADMDAGDPCIVYDKARNRYLAMVITGGGLVNAGNQDGGQNNGIALYSRAASEDAKWEPLHTKTVTTDSVHTISNNLAFETNALTALKAAYIKATGKELPSTKGYFQGPGHGMVTTQDVTDGEGNTIPAGTVVFPMQWFPQSGSSQAGALYSTDGGNWKATSLTDYAGAQENCIVELDDGSWLMVAKYNNTGRGYTRTTDFLTWSPVQLKSPARLVQGSIIKIGKNSEGKSRYAMITATEGSGGDYTRLNVRIFFATDATDDPTNASGIVWDPDTTAIALCPGNTGGQSYNSICLLEEGVIGVLYEANKHIYFERIDVRNRLD